MALGESLDRHREKLSRKRRGIADPQRFAGARDSHFFHHGIGESQQLPGLRQQHLAGRRERDRVRPPL
jgi:hypothetical protein